MTCFQVALMLLTVYLSAVQGHRLCHPTNATISAEKEGCPSCMTLTTSICSGYCQTREPVYKSALSSVYQHVCTYKEIRYDTIKLPDCQQGIDPFFTYPVAVSCECNLCKMDYSDCTVQSIGPDFCSSGLISQFQLIN
ncbi:lutropin subunit beta-like [Bombina bombina]|uniref:lutropin subunit beta-like n=1 Tax=Bombina bombina TaxID=8345 RepID=UPI00235A5469|nr:lutropin subunit beta-like [Bombina bombina]